MARKEDLTLRKQYRNQFDWCEVTRHMPPADLWAARQLGRVSHLELHHIFGRKGSKGGDVPSNLIVINPVIHRNWGHDSNPNELKIVCLYSKLMKSRVKPSPKNPHPELEFNIDELNDVAGKRVLGILENYLSDYDEQSDYFQMCKIITEAQDH